MVSVKNKDDHCLRLALRSALFLARDHVDRPSKYPTNDGLNFEGIDAPTPISQILKVEKLNNLAINVFGWDRGASVHRLSTQPEGMPRINLLLIEKADKFSLHLDQGPQSLTLRPEQATGATRVKRKKMLPRPNGFIR